CGEIYTCLYARLSWSRLVSCIYAPFLELYIAHCKLSPTECAMYNLARERHFAQAARLIGVQAASERDMQSQQLPRHDRRDRAEPLGQPAREWHQRARLRAIRRVRYDQQICAARLQV